MPLLKFQPSYLLKHTLASCLLNKQLLTLRLISINTVPSVSHCSTVMLYAVFSFLSLVYCAVQNGKDLNLWSVEVKEQNWGEGIYNQTGHFSFTPQIATCALLTCVIANVPISAIFTIMLSFIHPYIINHNQSTHSPQSQWTLHHRVYSAVCVLLHSVIKNVSISVFSTLVPFFIH